MLQRAQQATDLHFNADIRLNCEQCQNFRSQLHIHVIDILLENCPSFAGYEQTPLLQHKQRRKLPAAGHRTKQYPLQTSTIDESSIMGNIAVIHDVYINQMKRTHQQLSDRAIPSINDQSTNACIRGAKVLRTKDVNTFTKLQNLQLGFGLFHLVMNFIWALLHVHCGSINQTGSLSYFFALLDCTRLGCEHPDYHTLLATLLQILRGIILNTWAVECQYESLAQFAKSNPSPDELLLVADHILSNHATPLYGPPKRKAGKTTEPSCHVPDSSEEASPVNITHRNLQILTRDLLYVIELITTISSGDFGRVEDILGNLAMMFRGAGSNNYCSEILHFLFNIKRVWTSDFANIMRDSMLVNLSGLEGHFMPIDLNIEHCIKFLKVCS
ncbi:hypothetical protein PAXINDRAFT_81752 [Paxillus involutus ATCC 200175]|uniref:DUF6589 domain-containing protein n=1 Tax=Paxillus involutus ATCC 200175 TaxID=664439 RepID=A0A0C9TCA9_PAXIN|nr:hypothetical protein PAXINDRAFT_81752 [Paxillus involutus ATCC 200175]